MTTVIILVLAKPWEEMKEFMPRAQLYKEGTADIDIHITTGIANGIPACSEK